VNALPDFVWKSQRTWMRVLPFGVIM